MTHKEFSFNSMLAMVGTIVSMFLGGWDISLKVLMYCMIADYFTGVLGAFRTKSVNSEVMFWGGVRKAVILVVIALAFMLDQFVSNDSPIFRTMAIYFYVGREGLSIVENVGILGVPIPRFLRITLVQLQKKGEDSK